MPAAPRPDRETALRALLMGRLHALLSELAARPDLLGLADCAAVADHHWEAYLSVMPLGWPRIARGPAGEAPGPTAAEARVLAACGAEPLTAKTIARKLGRTCNTYLRSQLAALVRKGELVRERGRYRRPG